MVLRRYLLRWQVILKSMTSEKLAAAWAKLGSVADRLQRMSCDFDDAVDATEGKGRCPVAFERAALPRLDEALIVEWDQPGVLIVEVQAHLDESTVRGVALQGTAGLKRGVPVRTTGKPITVPVNPQDPEPT
jgi:hypothetical protein